MRPPFRCRRHSPGKEAATETTRTRVYNGVISGVRDCLEVGRAGLGSVPKQLDGRRPRGSRVKGPGDALFNGVHDLMCLTRTDQPSSRPPRLYCGTVAEAGHGQVLQCNGAAMPARQPRAQMKSQASTANPLQSPGYCRYVKFSHDACGSLSEISPTMAHVYVHGLLTCVNGRSWGLGDRGHQGC